MPLPDPTEIYPFRFPNGAPHRGMIFLSAAANHPQITVGDYTYMSVFDPPEDPARITDRLAPYLFPFSKERLTIGRFCAIAHGVEIITSSANHDMRGVTTYPFPIFDLTSREAMDQTDARDTTIGHDVWIGHGATILPGARIGNGAIIGTRAVVSGHVPSYAIVRGNPAKVVRMRFSPDEIAALEGLAWWDWPPDRIEDSVDTLQSGQVSALLSKDS
ncbi:CatB-related O-acetyltransferase [Aestuariibius sp. 2305UL40-4]|uniref:CatB-related O-acetyltransferase n=1 Tax=Aestuariibius violaceus TaxID=3234132 RepID=UPI00345EED41